MKYQVFQNQQIKYLVRYPENFREDASYPTLIFLHGAGSRGNEIENLISNPFFALIEKLEDFPFLVIAPQCHENTWFDLWEQLKSLVIQVFGFSGVDSTRLYLMGASMGGYGTWQLAMSMPEYFAAIVPICGGGMYWNAGRLINVPVWAFHGAQDPTVLLDESRKMTEAVKNNGGNARLTVYPDNGHDAWSDTYSNPEVYTWLLQHANSNGKTMKDQYNNMATYG